jgi:hypothetical protein
MEISQERIDELKKIIEKDGKKYTDEEARDAAYNLMGFAEICYKHWQTEQRWKKKLEENPHGFPLEDSGRCCCGCGGGTTPENSWYDKHGIKCLNCQRALDKKIIPVSVTRDRDNKTWFSKYDLERHLGIKTQTVKKLIREGNLKTREIKNNEGGTHFYVFLNKENPDWIKSTDKPQK